MNRAVYSVSQVNAYIKRMFAVDDRLRFLCVRGEISNCKYHSSGHIYFTIKDSMGQLSCVMFSGSRRNLSFMLEEGQNVIVTGSVQVYERDGKYQLYAETIEREGMGLLFEQTERLKRRLEEEGLFLAERKKPIPKYAFKIGIVTAKTGAAIHDIMQIAQRRNPYVQLYLMPALVQGDGAPASLSSAIRKLDSMGMDVMIVGRGGGSAEDLAAFSCEEVVRAVADAKTPVISAVGHEVDVALTDFAADLRAPTPSAAAELAVFEYAAWEERLAELHTDLAYGMKDKITACKSRVNMLGHRIQKRDPKHLILQQKERIGALKRRFSYAFSAKLQNRKHALSLLAAKLHAASPLVRLSGGYGYVTDEKNKPVVSVESVSINERLWITLKDGELLVRVEDKKQSDGR